MSSETPMPVPSSAASDDAMSGVAETAAVATETPVAEIYNLLLNLRFQFNPFNLPSIEEVILAIDNTFPEDPMKIVIPLRGAGQGLFKIILKKPVTDLSACEAEFTKITSGGTEVVSVPVSQDHDATPSSSFNSRKGTLVTFSQARWAKPPILAMTPWMQKYLSMGS